MDLSANETTLLAELKQAAFEKTPKGRSMVNMKTFRSSLVQSDKFEAFAGLQAKGLYVCADMPIKGVYMEVGFVMEKMEEAEKQP